MELEVNLSFGHFEIEAAMFFMELGVNSSFFHLEIDNWTWQEFIKLSHNPIAIDLNLHLSTCTKDDLLCVVFTVWRISLHYGLFLRSFITFLCTSLVLWNLSSRLSVCGSRNKALLFFGAGGWLPALCNNNKILHLENEEKCF